MHEAAASVLVGMHWACTSHQVWTPLLPCDQQLISHLPYGMRRKRRQQGCATGGAGLSVQRCTLKQVRYSHKGCVLLECLRFRVQMLRMQKQQPWMQEEQCSSLRALVSTSNAAQQVQCLLF